MLELPVVVPESFLSSFRGRIFGKLSFMRRFVPWRVPAAPHVPLFQRCADFFVDVVCPGVEKFLSRVGCYARPRLCSFVLALRRCVYPSTLIKTVFAVGLLGGVTYYFWDVITGLAGSPITIHAASGAQIITFQDYIDERHNQVIATIGSPIVRVVKPTLPSTSNPPSVVHMPPPIPAMPMPVSTAAPLVQPVVTTSDGPVNATPVVKTKWAMPVNSDIAKGITASFGVGACHCGGLFSNVAIAGDGDCMYSAVVVGGAAVPNLKLPPTGRDLKQLVSTFSSLSPDIKVAVATGAQGTLLFWRLLALILRLISVYILILQWQL